MAPPICLAGIRDVDRFPLCRHFFPHWLSLLCTYTCARRFGYPQDTNGILRMPRYPQDASGILRIRYPQDTAVSSGYRVLRIPARVLGYGVPRIPPPILGICRCPQDAPRVPGRQLAFSDGTRRKKRGARGRGGGHQSSLTNSPFFQTNGFHNGMNNVHA